MSFAISSAVFDFTATALKEDCHFYVARFTGTEALNSLFHFEIEVLCNEETAIDTKALVGTPAVFTIRRVQNERAVFSGQIAKIEQGRHITGFRFYTITLAPNLEKFKLTINNAIFLNSDLKEIIQKVLEQDQFFTVNHTFRFFEKYPQKEFTLQYNENSFDFILRNLEEQGAYFYYDSGGENIIFADSPTSHDPSQGSVIYYPAIGLETPDLLEIINSFKMNENILPKRVVVRNYDWKDPNTMLTGIAEVSGNGVGDVYFSDEQVASDGEAKRIAKIRAEQLLSTQRVYSGTGSTAFLRPGIIFTLTRHPIEKFNRDYLITKIKHSGAQEVTLNLVTGIPIPCSEEDLFYQNEFECIESNVTYRSSKTVPPKLITGSIHAFIDGDKSGEPVMDNYGRYKVWFPFDISGRSNGNASCWIRRSLEQIGKDSGLAFPLTPGTEVLISFVDGKPNQPVITGALPNGETGTLSGPGNNNVSGIRTPGGAQLTFDNKHNTMQLANTSGSEITFGAGSMDYTRQMTHIGLNATAVGASNYAGFLQSNMSGFISSSGVECGDWMTYAIGALASLAPAGVDAFLNYLSSKSSNASDTSSLNDKSPDWGATITKIAALIPFLIPDKERVYNLKITAEKKKVSNSMQCFPTTSELVKNIVGMLLCRITSTALDYADTKKKLNDVDAQDQGDINSFVQTLKESMQAVYDAAKDSDYAKFNGKAKDGAGRELKIGEYYGKVDVGSACGYYATTREAMTLSIKKLEIDVDDNLAQTEKANAEKHLQNLRKLALDLDSKYEQSCYEKQSKSNYYASLKQSASRNAMMVQASNLIPELGVIIAMAVWKSKLSDKHIGGILIDAGDKNINIHAKSYIGEHAERGIYLNTIRTKFKTKKIHRKIIKDKEVVELDEWGSWGAPTTKNTVDPDVAKIFEKIEDLPVLDTDKFVKGYIEEGHVNTKKKDWGEGIVTPENTENTFIAGQTHLYYMESKFSFQRSESQWYSISPRHIMHSIGYPTHFELLLGNIDMLSPELITIHCANSSDEKEVDLTMSISSFRYGIKDPADPEKVHGLSGTEESVTLAQYKKGEPSKVVLLDGKAQLSAGEDTSVSLTKDGVGIKGKKVVIGDELYVGKISGSENGNFIIGSNELKITGLKSQSDDLAEKLAQSITDAQSKIKELEDKIKALEEERKKANSSEE